MWTHWRRIAYLVPARTLARRADRPRTRASDESGAAFELVRCIRRPRTRIDRLRSGVWRWLPRTSEPVRVAPQIPMKSHSRRIFRPPQIAASCSRPVRGDAQNLLMAVSGRHRSVLARFRAPSPGSPEHPPPTFTARRRRPYSQKTVPSVSRVSFVVWVRFPRPSARPRSVGARKRRRRVEMQ